MHDMTIGKRFMITSGTCLVLLTILGLVANFGLINAGNSVVTLATNSVPKVQTTGDINADVVRIRGDYWREMGVTTPAVLAESEETIRKDRAGRDQSYQRYKLTIDDNDEDRGNYATLGSLIQAYDAAWQQVSPVIRSGNNKAAVEVYMKDCDPIYQQIKPQLAKMAVYNKAVAVKVAEESMNSSAHSLWITRLLAVFALAVGAVLSWFMTTRTNSILREATLALSDGSEQVVTAASQVSSSSQTLAQGASEQAASLEETSASTNEINSMARRNTENSQNTAEMVAKSQQSFTETNRLLEQLLGAMGGIDESSKKISKIIKVIDTIAFQTNILALNAAVEAARAGESGMGFAVVAEEVRSLAQRSAQAAKDTATLIEESIERAEGGKVNVDRVASAIRGLTAESDKMRILVDEIYVGSNEQSKRLDQIGRSILQIEQVTQGTAASSEESAAAAEELTAQAESMQEIVLRMRRLVDGDKAQAMSASAASRSKSQMFGVLGSRQGEGSYA